jgi:DNA-binding NarL/FixJ family response regulator
MPPLGRRRRADSIPGVQRTVLIVDDHEGFRTCARRTLELDGWEVVGEAPDGASGIEAAGRLAPALVLLDIGLPDFNGFEVAARLRTNRTAAAIVFISTHDAADFGGLPRDSHALGFLPKAELSGAALAGLLAQR